MKISISGSECEILSFFRELSLKEHIGDVVGWEVQKKVEEAVKTSPTYEPVSRVSPPPSVNMPLPYMPEVAVLDVSKLPLEEEAWKTFKNLVELWLIGFGDESASQPDRLSALKDIGSGRWPALVIRWIVEHGTLQASIYQALQESVKSTYTVESATELTEAVAANMAQVAHAAFPDLLTYYDHSTRWKRKIQ